MTVTSVGLLVVVAPELLERKWHWMGTINLLSLQVTNRRTPNNKASKSSYNCPCFSFALTHLVTPAFGALSAARVLSGTRIGGQTPNFPGERFWLLQLRLPPSISSHQPWAPLVDPLSQHACSFPRLEDKELQLRQRIPDILNSWALGSQHSRTCVQAF